MTFAVNNFLCHQRCPSTRSSTSLPSVCNLCEMTFTGAVELAEHGSNIHRQSIVLEEDGQLVMREESNPMMRNSDVTLESVIIDADNVDSSE